ncbi:BQ5605_C027g10400 [Microbotryum silenes-dioicae]|uniref:BQ5605_C027g10400 protein n=1 Tax=Microbotryum silenes-dioicae TaxID=796604 RepID=A0A2X0N9L8_9BASI|nr:BQ5605_C027g10400 [Microbotryum silenes-dioicae]
MTHGIAPIEIRLGQGRRLWPNDKACHRPDLIARMFQWAGCFGDSDEWKIFAFFVCFCLPLLKSCRLFFDSHAIWILSVL